MNRQSGYTLIELIVVICVLGLMLGFTIPRIQEAVTLDPFEKTSRQLAILIRTLKQAAVADQKVIVLHIDASRNRFWESDDTMPEEGLELAQGKANRLPSGISFSKVTVTGEKRPDDGVARIRFYPKGYSDGAVIQLEGERRRRRYFTVEPFLAQVRMTDEGWSIVIACREKMFQHEISGRCISGFTLLEVMAAVAMLSIVMAGVYRLHSQTVMMHQRARFYVTASFLAQQKLSQLETAKISELTEDKGDFGKDFEGYTWRVKVGEVEGDAAEALGETVKRLKKIQLGVLLNDGEFTLEIGTSRFFTG